MVSLQHEGFYSRSRTGGARLPPGSQILASLQIADSPRDDFLVLQSGRWAAGRFNAHASHVAMNKIHNGVSPLRLARMQGYRNPTNDYMQVQNAPAILRLRLAKLKEREAAHSHFQQRLEVAKAASEERRKLAFEHARNSFAPKQATYNSEAKGLALKESVPGVTAKIEQDKITRASIDSKIEAAKTELATLPVDARGEPFPDSKRRFDELTTTIAELEVEKKKIGQTGLAALQALPLDKLKEEVAKMLAPAAQPPV